MGVEGRGSGRGGGGGRGGGKGRGTSSRRWERNADDRGQVCRYGRDRNEGRRDVLVAHGEILDRLEVVDPDLCKLLERDLEEDRLKARGAVDRVSSQDRTEHSDVLESTVESLAVEGH